MNHTCKQHFDVWKLVVNFYFCCFYISTPFACWRRALYLHFAQISIFTQNLRAYIHTYTYVRVAISSTAFYRKQIIFGKTEFSLKFQNTNAFLSCTRFPTLTKKFRFVLLLDDTRANWRHQLKVWQKARLRIAVIMLASQ